MWKKVGNLDAQTAPIKRDDDDDLTNVYGKPFPLISHKLSEYGGQTAINKP